MITRLAPDATDQDVSAHPFPPNAAVLLHLYPREAEAIVPAADLKADVALIDEHEGREVASEAGLSVMGILGVLLKATHNGRIPAVRPEIQTFSGKG